MVLRQIVCSGFSLRSLYLRPLREIFPPFSSLAFITAFINVHLRSSVENLTWFVSGAIDRVTAKLSTAEYHSQDLTSGA